MKQEPLAKKAGPDYGSGNPFNLGYDMCHAGYGKHQNPCLKDSEDYEMWRRGWEKRYYNDPSGENL